MFHVGRYDPSKKREDGGGGGGKKKPKDKKKRKNNDSSSTKTQSSIPAVTTATGPAAEGVVATTGGIKAASDRKQGGTNNKVDRSNKRKNSGEEDAAPGGAVKKEPKKKKNKLQVIAKAQKEENQILDSLDGRFDRLIQIEIEEDDDDKRPPGPSEQGEEEPLPAGAVSHEVSIALELSKRPIRELAVAWKLKPFLVENLSRQGLSHFFPIQNLTIPHIIATSPYIQAPDLMITAPTGSGKTLSYVLPMLQAVSVSGPRLLRTIIILPGRELAVQVESVLRQYCVGSSIRVGLAVAGTAASNSTGITTDLTAEHAILTDGDVDDCRIHNPSRSRRRLDRDPANVRLAMDLLDEAVHQHYRMPTTPLIESSPIDILVCTPGRLMDHLDHAGDNGGGGLSLRYLRHLVVDEADRLLTIGSYQNWLDRVLQLAPSTVRTILVSATATTDPRRTERFHNLQHLTVASTQRLANVLTLPSSLQEYSVECAAVQKPLVLVSILMEQQQLQQQLPDETTTTKAASSSITMVFCSSLEATHRLARLLQLLWVALGYDERDIGEMSSSVRGSDRRSLMDRCRGGDATADGQQQQQQRRLSVLVCSDSLARGLDLEQIHTIVQYDIPVTSPKTYVHRCGRTARAGRSGRAISLIKTGQAEAFRKMRALIRPPPPSSSSSGECVPTWPIQKNLVNDAIRVYPRCMDALQKLLQAENDGKLRRGDAVRPYLDEDT